MAGLAARGPTRPRGPDRRGAGRGAHAGAANDPLRDRRDLPAGTGRRCAMMRGCARWCSRSRAVPWPGGSSTIRARGRGRSWSGSRPAESAGPTCTCSTASWPSRSCRWSSDTRWSARWSARGRGPRGSGPGPGSASRGWAGPAASAATAAQGARTSAREPGSPATRCDGGYAELAVADERFCLPLPETASATEIGAAALRRADRLPGPADVRGRRADRPLRVRRLRPHRLPGRGRPRAGGSSRSPGRATPSVRPSPAGSAPSGRGRSASSPSRSTRRSSSPRSASWSRRRCGRWRPGGRSSARAST